MTDAMTDDSGAPYTNRADLRTPVRNHYFRGKLLDAYHMQLETDYVNKKRWLMNRLVLGSGVALGLDVKRGTDHRSIVITPGLAIDWHGREVIVAKETPPIAIDPAVVKAAVDHHKRQEEPRAPKKPAGAGGGGKPSQGAMLIWVQVRIAYDEELADPVPADPGTECGPAQCVPGSIREVYQVKFEPAPDWPDWCQCPIRQAVSLSEIDHRELARWVTRERPKRDLVPRRSPHILLANVPLDWHDENNWGICPTEHIRIEVRPVLYYNDLLFQCILALAEPPEGEGGK